MVTKERRKKGLYWDMAWTLVKGCTLCFICLTAVLICAGRANAACDISYPSGLINVFCMGGGKPEDMFISSNDQNLCMSIVTTRCDQIAKNMKSDSEKQKSEGDAVWNSLWILKTQFSNLPIADVIKDIMEAESCGQSLIVNHTTADIERIANSLEYAQLITLAMQQNWSAYKQLLNELYSGQCSNGYSWPWQPGATATFASTPIAAGNSTEGE
ncbi:MAG: hypothetical protein ACLQF0_09145 [Dissulfurispiraceae bacterium]